MPNEEMPLVVLDDFDLRARTQRDADLAILRAREKEWQDAINKISGREVWLWQNDGYDHLESLICPIVIKAEDLRDLFRAERLKEAEWLEKWVLGAEVWPEGDESFDVEKLEGWVERIKAHIVSLEAGGKDAR